MSEFSSINESQSSISGNNLRSVEQSMIDLDEISFTGPIKSSVIDQLSPEENVANVDNKNNECVNGFKSPTKKNIQPKYPLTEKSKRENAAKARMERDKKSEQIKKTNENIMHSVKTIRNHTKKVHGNKLESLIKINNNQWYCYDKTSTDDLQSSFDAKIELLELNLKKLEEELILEKNRLAAGIKERATTVDGDDDDIANDENLINTNTYEKKEVTKKDHRNSMELLDELALMDVGTLNNTAVHQTVSKRPETRLTFSPKIITLNVKKTGSAHVTNGIFRQHITVSNRSKSVVFCRYSRLFDPNLVFQDCVNTIHVRPVAWCRLQPAITVDYAVTFKPAKLPNSVTYPSLNRTELVFETASNSQPDVLYVFHIPIEFCMIKPEPELVTKTITFAAGLNSSKNVNPKKYLVLKNNGNADCVFSVLRETEYQKTYNHNGSSTVSYFTEITKNDKSTKIIGDIINTVFHNMFRHFMWSNHRDILLPAKRSVKVPVKFNQNLARSSISECYTIMFANDEYMIPNQKLYITGHVKNQIIVKPDVIDVGLCYLTSSVQVAKIHLQNDNRVMVPFEIKIPRELSKHVKLSHSKGYLKARSSVEVFIRLDLKYDILKPDTCRAYFNADSGCLDFPVWVYASNTKMFSEVRVMAVVTTPFGLKFTPNTLDFGTVNTTETVVRNIMLANHSRTTMAYGFLKLPERVSVYPSAFGTILSCENVQLHVHYSPSAKDLPENVHTFADDFVLTCNTITGLNAKEFNSNLKTTEQLHGTTTMNTSILSDSQKSEIISIKEINDLDHGPDKIQIIKTKNTVEVNSLDENAILKEATITCHATIHDIPVEISVQKIIFAKTHFTSYSSFKIELRASNLASIVERNLHSFPDFKIRFEFVSNDPCVEFKPKNGILQSREVVQIYVILRPKLDNQLQKLYEKYLRSKATEVITETILKDPNSYINQIYKKGTFSNKQINAFEAKTIFYSSLKDKTSIVSAACFIQFIKQKSEQYFGFDTGSLKLSLVCPTTKPNVILFGDQIDFGECATDVRHDGWLLVRNVAARPVPLKISPTDPTGPFFCDFAMNGEQWLSPGHTAPINVSFTPERETPVNEVLEITSGTMRLTVRLSGSGLAPSCDVEPSDIINVIQTTYGRPNEKFIFRVTNTSGVSIRFNVQLEWTKWHPEPMTDEESYNLVETFRTDHSTVPITLQLDGPDWTVLEKSDDEVFDLGNGGRPLWFRLEPGGIRYVEVTFRPPAAVSMPLVRDEMTRPEREGNSRGSTDGGGDGGSTGMRNAGNSDRDDNASSVSVVYRRRLYAAKLNVHVGRSVLRLLYVLGFAV